MTRACRMPILVLLSFSVVHCLIGQQPATPNSLLAGALAGLGGTNIQGVTLTGNSESTAGATDDTGPFTANCTTSGSSQLSLQLSNGSRTETRQVTNGITSGSWLDSQGVQHSMVSHNLYVPASWFCPAVALSQVVSASNLNIQFIGDEEKNGATLAHFTITSIPSGTGPQIALLTHLSQLDIFLDPQTLRPVVFDFNVHPDKDAGTDIPIEIRFSNYTEVNGVWFPFTIQRYLNSSLALTLEVQSATASLRTAIVQ